MMYTGFQAKSLLRLLSFDVNKAKAYYYELFNSWTSIINSKLTQHPTATDRGQSGQAICFLAYVVRFDDIHHVSRTMNPLTLTSPSL